MDHVLQDFIEQLFESENAADFQTVMTEALIALNLPYFAYLAPAPKPRSSPLLISNYPTSWTSHYLRNQYEQFDPVIQWATNADDPFTWGLEAGIVPLTEAQRKLFDEAAQFEIRYGLTVPVHYKDGPFAAVTFAAGERFPVFERRIRYQARMLKLMAYCFHAHARRKVSGHAGSPLLSPRERECLHWAAEGKSCWEIGRILDISRRTVAFHLENAKAKLGVKTSVQAAVAMTTRHVG